MTSTSPTLLERLCLASDPLAWQRLLTIYEPLLRHWLGTQAVPGSDIDDLVQDVLVVVYRRITEFQHNGRTGAFRTWLKMIVANRAREFWRNGRLHGVGVPLPDELEDPQGPLSAWWDREHDRIVARRLLAQLHTEFSPEVWERFCLLVLENLSGEEVARRTGSTLNTVYAAKSRVLARMRRELAAWVDV